MFSSIKLKISRLLKGENVMNSAFTEHLLEKLNEHFENIQKQQGKSDIELESGSNITKEWYECILSYITLNPPLQYVKTINLNLDTQFNIINIEYVYCDACDYVSYISVNLFDI